MKIWVDAGVRLVWVAYPDTESIAIDCSKSDAAVLSGDDIVNSGVVLPGFSARLKDIFS